nr:TANK-binding kinase 1-binding protein 1-like [Aegilops tauschii subsp. strangulata]
MAQLREDLLGADLRLVAGPLELASGWLHSDSAVRGTLSQAAASSEKEKQSAVKAAADHDTALKDAEAARGRCQELEDELKHLRDQHAEEARGRQVKEEEMRAREDTIKNRDAELEELEKAQATERSRLEELERGAKAKKNLDAKTKVLAEDRTTFADLEERRSITLARASVSPNPDLSDASSPDPVVPGSSNPAEPLAPAAWPPVTGAACPLLPVPAVPVAKSVFEPNRRLGASPLLRQVPLLVPAKSRRRALVPLPRPAPSSVSKLPTAPQPSSSTRSRRRARTSPVRSPASFTRASPRPSAGCIRSSSLRPSSPE